MYMFIVTRVIVQIVANMKYFGTPRASTDCSLVRVLVQTTIMPNEIHSDITHQRKTSAKVILLNLDCFTIVFGI